MTTDVATSMNLLTLGKKPNVSPQLGAPSKKGIPSVFSNLLSFEKELSKDSDTFNLSPKALLSSVMSQTNQNLDQTRQMAMNIFLDKMKTKFGVTPEQILKAFSKLSAHDLAQPPEKTVDDFIAQLKLNQKDQKGARDLYSKMLGILATINGMQNRVAQISRADGLAGDSIAKPKAIVPLLATQSPIAGTSTTIGNTTGVVEGATTAVNAVAKPATDVKTASQPTATKAAENVATSATKAANVTSAKSAAGTTVAAATATAGANEVSGPSMASAAKTAAAATSATATPAAATSTTATAVAAKAPTAPAAPTVSTLSTPTASTTAALTAAGAAAAKSTAMSAYDRNSSGESADHHDHSGAGGNSQNQSTITAATSTQTSTPPIVSALKANHVQTASPVDVKNNAQELAMHAQLLAHKGGGEVNVKLYPEGLGSVHVKVNLNQGHLNVEMLASNDSAKQVIEKGLGDLRTALAAHHFRVDTLRVDTPQDLAQQFLYQHQHQAEQGFQQQFLNNFQDQNGANRQAMFDFGSPEIPQSQIQDRAANSRYSAASIGKKSNRRLDLVA